MRLLRRRRETCGPEHRICLADMSKRKTLQTAQTPHSGGGAQEEQGIFLPPRAPSFPRRLSKIPLWYETSPFRGKRVVDKTAKPMKSFSVPPPFREGQSALPLSVGRGVSHRMGRLWIETFASSTRNRVSAYSRLPRRRSSESPWPLVLLRTRRGGPRLGHAVRTVTPCVFM